MLDKIRLAVHKYRKYIIVILIALILVTIYLLWGNIFTHDMEELRRDFQLPPPIAGYGPYGYGTYLPPMHTIANAVANS